MDQLTNGLLGCVFMEGRLRGSFKNFLSIFTAQFFCEPKTASKYKVLVKQKAKETKVIAYRITICCGML